MALPQEKLNPTQAPPEFTKEYVVSLGYWSARIGRILSNFNDDLEWMIGWDVYERMARDPVVAKNLLHQKLAVISEGVELYPPVGKTDPEFNLAEEIRDFCERSMEGLHRPITEIISEMMVALKRGHAVAEITYNEPISTGVDAYKLTLKSIKTKPRNTTCFVIDAYRNVLGLTAWLYGTQGMVSGTRLNSGQALIPREKFAVLAFETEDEDPRGINPLRPAYNFWQAKCLVPALHLKWLEKSGIPSTIGFTAPNAGFEQSRDSSDNPSVDSLGNAVVKSAQEAMADTLALLENGSSAAFPNGALVQSHGVAGDGSQFTRCYSDFNKEIDFAMTLQAGASSDSTKSGSKAAKRILKDVFDVLIWSRKHHIAQMLRNDVFKNLVRYNFGDENAHLTPTVMIGDDESKDWAIDAQAAAVIGPFLTDSQWNTLCEELGISAPEEGEELPNRVKATPAGNMGDTADPNNNSDTPMPDSGANQ